MKETSLELHSQLAPQKDSILHLRVRSVILRISVASHYSRLYGGEREMMNSTVTHKGDAHDIHFRIPG